MNCECFYALKNENTLENARNLAVAIHDTAEKQREEVIPIYISRAIKRFYGTSDYDNYNKNFLVKEGEIIVFAYGKDYCMNRIRPKGGRRGFPDRWKNPDFFQNFYSYIEDIEEVNILEYKKEMAAI